MYPTAAELYAGTRAESVRATRVDGRRKVARRAAKLAATFTAQLAAAGHETATVLVTTNIVRAAELTALSEATRARLLRGTLDASHLDDLVRLERLASAAVGKLGLPAGSPLPASPSLEQYLATRGDDAA